MWRYSWEWVRANGRVAGRELFEKLRKKSVESVSAL
jgi:hypothetical protein